jgi:hypothetical protein
LRKAVVQFDGGRADLISEYYFWNDTLIFVLKTRTDYEKPKWADDFNATSKTIKENRYYFNKDELIQWIESDKKQVDLSKVDKKIEKEIISDSKLYMHIN